MSYRKVKSKYCKACKMEKAKEVHHIIGRFEGGGDNEKNLIDLCCLCHEFAPNGVEEMKEHVKCNGFRGSIINNGVLFTLSTLSTLTPFAENFYDKIGKLKGMVKIEKEVQKKYRDRVRSLIEQKNAIIK